MTLPEIDRILAALCWHECTWREAHPEAHFLINELRALRAEREAVIEQRLQTADEGGPSSPLPPMRYRRERQSFAGGCLRCYGRSYRLVLTGSWPSWRRLSRNRQKSASRSLRRTWRPSWQPSPEFGRRGLRRLVP